MARSLSPSIHPAVIERYYLPDYDDAALVAMREALEFAREAGERANAIADAILADESTPEAGRHLRIKRETEKVLTPAYQRIDAARERAMKHLTEIAKATAGPERSREVVDCLLDGTILNRLAGMTQKDRNKTLGQAIMDKADSLVFRAVLHAPPMASGLTRDEHDAYRDRYRRTRHPQEVDREERIGRAVADTDTAGQALLNHGLGLYKRDLANRAAASADRVTKALGA